MAIKYMRSLVDNDWSNDLNWSLSSGGANDTTKAIATDDVIVEASVCVVSTTEECASFTSTGNPSFTFDGALSVIGNFNITNLNGLSGTGTVNVQGDFTYTDAASSSNTIIFTLDGTGDQDFNWSGSASAINFDLRVNKLSGTVNNIANMNASGTATARCRLTMIAGNFDGGAFDCKWYSLNIDGGVYTGGSARNEITTVIAQTAGTHNATSGTLTVSGSAVNWNKTGGTFNHSNGELEVVGGNSLTMSNIALEVFYDLNINKGVWDVILTGGPATIQVTNSLTINNSLFSLSPALTGTIELTGTASLIQNGNMSANASGGVPTGWIFFTGTNHTWTQNNVDAAATLCAIKVACSGSLTFIEGAIGNVFGVGSFDFQSGTLINSENITLRNNHQGQHFVFKLWSTPSFGSINFGATNFDTSIFDAAGTGPADIQTGNFTFASVGTGTDFRGAGSNLFVSGNYEIGSENLGASTVSEPSVVLNGTGNQTISVGAGNELWGSSLTVNKASGKVTQLTDIFITRNVGDLELTAGTWDTNGFNLKAKNDLTINDNFADLAGSTITVTGNFSATGSDLKSATTDWFLDVSGTSEATACDIQHCDASLGQTLIAAGSVNSGNNTNVSFIALLKYNIAIAAHNASDNTAWSLTSGGANDTTAPAILDTPVFDANSTGACTWDIASVDSINMETTFASQIIQTANLIVLNKINHNGGNWDQTAAISILCTDYESLAGTSGVWNKSISASFEATRDFVNAASVATGGWDGFIKVGTNAQESRFKILDNINRTNVEFAGGSKIKAIDRMYVDVFLAATAPYELYTDGSQVLIVRPSFPQPTDIIWTETTIDAFVIQLQESFIPALVIDFGTAEIVFTDTETILDSLTDIKTTGSLFHSKLDDIRVLTVNGNLKVGACTIGSTIGINRGGKINGSGSVKFAELTVMDSTHDTIRENILDLATISSFVCTGNFSVQQNATMLQALVGIELQIGGDCLIDSGSFCSFINVAVNCYGDGDILNALYANRFSNITCAHAGKTSTCLGFRLKFQIFCAGGSFAFNGSNVVVDSENGGLQFGGGVTFIAGGSGGFTISTNTPKTILPAIDIFHTMTVVSGTSELLELSGPFTGGSINIWGNGVTTGGVKTNNHPMTFSSITLGLNPAFPTAGAGLIAEASIITCGSLTTSGTAVFLTNEIGGEINIANKFLHRNGIADLKGSISCGEFEPFAGVVLNVDGEFSCAEDFNPLAVAYSAVWGASSILRINGTIDQDLYFAGGGEPPLLICDCSGSLYLKDGPLLGGTVIELLSTLGDTTVKFVPAVPYSIDTIETPITNTNKRILLSTIPATQYEITLGQQNPIGSQYIDITDSKFIDYVMVIDSNNSNDVSNNYYNDIVPEGLLAEQFDRVVDGGSVLGNGLGVSEVLIGGIVKSKLLQANGLDSGSYKIGVVVNAETKQPSAASGTFKDITSNFANIELIQPNGQSESVLGSVGATFLDVYLAQDSGTLESEVKDCVIFAEEETALDKKMVPLAFNLIKKFGKTAEFTAFTGESYDPLVGETTAVAHAVYRWKIVPPFPIKKSFSVENTGEVGKLISYVAAQDIPFIPEIGMDVQIDCERWTIDSVGPIRSGAKIAIYELSMRQ